MSTKPGELQLLRFASNLRASARALYHLDATAPENRAEGFELAQWTLQRETADALSAMAARFAKGDGDLAKLVREQQDLLGDQEAAYRSLDAASGRADVKAAESARTSIAEIGAKLKETEARLRRDFPDYADFASPKPLAIKDTQALLGENQALVLFLDLPQFGKVPEETLVFVLTKEEAQWTSVALGSNALGSNALRERVSTLRCGLDKEEWEGIEKPARCQRLLGEESRETASRFPSISASPMSFMTSSFIPSRRSSRTSRS